MALTKATYSMIEGAMANVLDFGAVGDGVTNDTAAFNAAIATGKAVYVPYTENGYLVSNVNVVDNMVIVGEKSGLTQGSTQGAPLLIVATSGTAAFYNNVGTNVFDVWFENLACTAASGVTNASFYKSSTQTFYSAYFTFKNIETYKNLRYGYVGLFIFALWDRCRDGYLGSASDTSHTCIEALATYGQTNAQNVNMVRDSMLFGSFGGTGAVVVQYGNNWTFENTDFEAMQVPAFVGQNVFNAVFDKCWFETVDAATLISAEPHPTEANAGSSVYVYNSYIFAEAANTTFIDITSAVSSASVSDNRFGLVPLGMTLANDGDRVLVNDNNEVAASPGQAGFMTGMHPTVYVGSKQLVNGATDNGVAVFNFQNEGGIAATEGFLSTVGTAVSTSFVDIASAVSGIGGLCFVSGFNTVGGAQGWWLVAFISTGAVATLIASNDATATTPSFQVSAGKLRMRTTTGTLSVNTTLLG